MNVSIRLVKEHSGKSNTKPNKSIHFVRLFFSEVFKARCKKTNDFVAMKLILMDQEKEGFPITALREIKILQELRHDNIVRLIEVCRSSSKEYGFFFLDFIIKYLCFSSG
jgi:cyclin-dependent kinase 9